MTRGRHGITSIYVSDTASILAKTSSANLPSIVQLTKTHAIVAHQVARLGIGQLVTAATVYGEVQVVQTRHMDRLVTVTAEETVLTAYAIEVSQHVMSAFIKGPLV
jgi:hypothetical protein